MSEDLKRKVEKMEKRIIHLSNRANYYRHKCKIFGGTLASDGAVPSNHDLSLLKQLEKLAFLKCEKE